MAIVAVEDAEIQLMNTDHLKDLGFMDPEVVSALEEPSTGTVLEELSSALTELEVVSALEEPRTGTAHRVPLLSPRTDATANMWTS